METAKRWFGKFRPKEKHKTSNKKKEPIPYAKEGPKTPLNDETPSDATRQKVAAAKQYIEKHYKEQTRSLEERRERYDIFSHYNLSLYFVSCNFFWFPSIPLCGIDCVLFECNSFSAIKLPLSGDSHSTRGR